MQHELTSLVTERIPGASVRTGERGVEVTVKGQTAYIREHVEESALLVYGVVGPECLAPARAVLELAGRMGSGGLALVEGTYVVRVTIPRVRLDQASLPDTVAYVGHLARVLANRLHLLRPVVDPTTLFCGGD